MEATDQHRRRVRLIGPGRAGRSMVGALAQRGWTIVEVLVRGDDVDDAARDVDVVMLAVPDDAIAEVAAAIKPGPAVVVHLSGAKTLEALAPHRRRASLHPLVSLPSPEIGVGRLLAGATMAVAGDPIAATMAETLGARIIEVGDDDRALYHATAAVAANHLVVLCAQVEKLAGVLGLPVDVYWDLMTATLANVVANGAAPSLTGPAARGDRTTIAAHLDALPPSERGLYRAMADAAVQLASGTVDSLGSDHHRPHDDSDHG